MDQRAPLCVAARPAPPRPFDLFLKGEFQSQRFLSRTSHWFPFNMGTCRDCSLIPPCPSLPLPTLLTWPLAHLFSHNPPPPPPPPPHQRHPRTLRPAVVFPNPNFISERSQCNLPSRSLSLCISNHLHADARLRRERARRLHKRRSLITLAAATLPDNIKKESSKLL